MSELKEVMLKLEELTKLIAGEPTPTSLATIPDNLDCGDVCYTRLYKSDETLMDDICKRTGRKKSQVIRILVSEGLRRGVIDAKD